MISATMDYFKLAKFVPDTDTRGINYSFADFLDKRLCVVHHSQITDLSQGCSRELNGAVNMLPYDCI